MIVGVVAPNDRSATSVLEEIGAAMAVRWAPCSVRQGVAVACSASNDSNPSCASGSDHAYIGALRGELPSPGVELPGDFAFIGSAEGRLRLARGRFVGRPLYWLRVGSTTVASTRLLPLAVAARADLRLNPAHLFALFDPRLRIWPNPPPFVGVQTVCANTLVDIDRFGGARISEGPVRLEPELTLPTHELAGALRDEFSSAVARECTGARRVAVLGGGGVDSSNLLAMAVRNARRSGTASVVPVAFDFGGIGDDRPHLRALCSHLDVKPVRIAPSDGAAYGLRDRVVDGAAHLSVPGAFVMAAMARMRSVGAQAVLVGESSELLLDSEAAVFGDFLMTQPLRALACAGRFTAIYETRRQSWRRLVGGPLLRHALPPFALALRYKSGRRRAAKHRLRELDWAGPRLRTFFATERQDPFPPPIYSQRERVRRLASSGVLMAQREFQSRWELACGLRVSLPYFDDDFVRFAGRIPSGAMFAGARERGLLRESMEGLVPDSVRYRMDKARPNEASAEAFAVLEGTPAFEDLLSMRELDAMGIVDAKRFGTAFQEFALDPRADPSLWGSLWPAITAEAYARWFRAFKTCNVDVTTSLVPSMVAS